MKYKVGDKVRIKSLDWYNKNKDINGNVDCGFKLFTYEMSKFCGYVMTVCNRTNFGVMTMNGSASYWTDEMIEGLVDKSQQSIYDTGIIGIPLAINAKYYRLTINDESCSDKVEITLDGYIMIQEDGKWFAVKKEKPYPKTFEECVHVLEGENRMSLEQMNTFRKLIDARNAYWKIAGDEMGLGKPWEPDWTNNNEVKFIIGVSENEIIKCCSGIAQYILAFPTEEMRDAFYENFKELIEQCKELL